MPSQTSPSTWKLTLLVSLLSMIGPFTIDTYLPSFESMEQDFNISRVLLTQTLGFYLIAFAFSTLVWGAVSDWLGRKPVILLALGSYFLASIACSFATNYEQFLTFRILQGLGIGGSLISGRAMVRDVLGTKDAQKVMAKAMMLFAIAPAIAPIIGGWLHDIFGWRSVFWFLSLYALAVFFFTWFATKESLAPNKRTSIHLFKVTAVYFSTLKDAHYVRLVLVFSAAFSSFFLYVAGAPTLLFNVLGLVSTDFYILFVPVVSGILIGAFISNLLINRFTGEQMINVVISLMLLIAISNVLITLLLETSIVAAVIPLIFYSISLATIMPIFSILILNCFPNNRGSASAMQSFIQMGFNGFVVSFIVALLGANNTNFALAQTGLISVGVLLWAYDRWALKAGK